MSNPFKSKHDFETRKTESEKIQTKYPNRFPVIIHKSKKCKLDEIEKTKFLIPGDLTMGQVIYIVSILPPTSSTISSIYEEHKDEDGFLYISYCNENVFG